VQQVVQTIINNDGDEVPLAGAEQIPEAGMITSEFIYTTLQLLLHP
jgi:hypothetical protein